MKKKIIVSAVTVILAVIALIFGIEYSDNDIKEISEGVETVVNIIEDNMSSTEIPNLSEEDEQILEVQETEAEGFKEQGEIAYNGSEKAPNIDVGEYVGLTYYSQTDSRWGNKVYTSIGDNSQTIASSGCGPTAAAMIVSSIKGTITPDKLADLYVQYGYRSANQGTYWSAFKWTADVFDIGYSECYNLDEAITKLKDNNYIIASCNQGLFTYGGHFIVLIGLEGNYIKVYDPYLYSGKFDVSSRINKAELKGNIVYVSIDNFKNYANAKGYFCFKNNRTEIKENTTTPVINNTVTSNVNNVNYQAKITANSGLNIRNGASTSYKIVGYYSKNTTVTILAENNKWGKTDKGWICLDYISKINISGANGTSTYAVKSGDCLSLIGKRLNVDWRTIASANNIYSPYRIYKGQKLTIPSSINKKSNEQICREIWRGKWGNGKNRISKLKQAGYDANLIQRMVNRGIGK